MTFDDLIMFIPFAIVGIGVGIWGSHAAKPKPQRTRSDQPASYMPLRGEDASTPPP